MPRSSSGGGGRNRGGRKPAALGRTFNPKPKKLPASKFAGAQTKGSGKARPKAKTVTPSPKPAPKSSGRPVALGRKFNAPKPDRSVPKLKRKPVGVLAPGAKFNYKTGNVTAPKPIKPANTKAFEPKLDSRGPEQWKKLSKPNPGVIVNGQVRRSGRYKPGTVEFKAARRFTRSPMGKLNRELKRQERSQSRLAGKPIKLQLDRKTGKVTRLVGAKAIAKNEALKTQRFVAKREARKRAARSDAGNTIVGAGREAGKALAYVAARGQSLNPIEALGRVAGAEAAKKIVGKKKAKKLEASGLPGLPNSLSKEIQVEKPENVLRIMDQTQRPIRGIASAEKQVVRNVKSGKPVTAGVGGQAVRGLKLKNNTYSSDVLKEVGIGGTAAVIAGFGLDVLQDPLTYVTFGAGSVARQGVMKAAKAAEKRVYKKAYAQLTKAGVEKKTAERQARAFGVRARRAVEERGDKVRTYQRTYAKNRRAAKKSGASDEEAHKIADKAGKKAAGKLDHLRIEVGTKRHKVGTTIRRKEKAMEAPTHRRRGRLLASATVSPKTSPVRSAKDAWAAGLALNRRVRAKTNEGVGSAQRVAEQYSDAVKPEHYDDFIHALETNDKSALPKYLTEPSINARVQISSTRAYREAFSSARKSGASKAEATAAAKRAAAKAPRETRKVSIFDATRASLRNELKIRRNAGVVTGKIRNYFPHMVDDALRSKRPDLAKAEEATAEAEAFVQSRARRRAPAVGSSMGRKIKKTRREANDELRAAGKPEFTADVPLARGTYRLQTSNAEAQDVFNRGVASMGREVKITAEPRKTVKMDAEGNPVKGSESTKVRRTVGEEDVAPAHGEKVYVQVLERRTVHDGSEQRKGPAQVIVREANQDEARKLAAGQVPRNVRRVFVANDHAVHRAEQAFNQYSVVPGKFAAAMKNKHYGAAIGYGFLDKIYDPVHRAWKNVAVRTPQFHMRNMIGDTSMAYNHVPGHLMPGLMRDALRITHYLRGVRGNFMGFSHRDKNLWIGNKVHGELMSMEDFANEMIENGVILGGVLGNDLESLSKFGARGIVKKNSKIRQFGRSIDRTLQDRENLMRMVVYKHYRDEGLSADDAARKVADALIDYGELTAVEKEGFKRVAPFYVFAARSIPMYAMTLIQRPGKLANIEKLRQEAGKAQGMSADDLKGEASFMQRGYAFPLRIGGTTYFPTAGLPLFALNMLPAGFSGGDLEKVMSENFRYWASTLGPLPGSVVETATNKSFFYNKTIEPDYKGNRVAPAIQPLVSTLGHVPVVKDLLNIGPFFDKRTGKIVTGWRGRADNVVGKFTPGAAGFAINMGRDVTARGQTRLERGASFGLGVKLDRSNPRARADEIAFKKWGSLKKRMDTLNQEGDTASVKKKKEEVGKQMAVLERYLYQSTKAQGYKKPLFANRAPKDPFALPALPELPKLPTLGQ